MKVNYNRKKLGLKASNMLGQILLNVFFVIFCVIILYPFVMLVSASLSSEYNISMYGYRLIPISIDFSAYKYVMKNPTQLLNAYEVTIAVSVIYMVLSVILMAMIAYPLSRDGFKGKRGLSFYLYFTMLFSGGLAPSYILITQFLHLNNTLWVYILPGLISPWYVFMMRTFFSGIPTSIIESAEIDGAREFQIFTRFVFPLSKPVIAAVALFMFLSKWNDWFTAMLYIDDEKLISLQYLLQRILKKIELLSSLEGNARSLAEGETIPAQTVRMAMAMLVAGPALVVFPFFQKYFVKGLTVGAVKG